VWWCEAKSTRPKKAMVFCILENGTFTPSHISLLVAPCTLAFLFPHSFLNNLIGFEPGLPGFFFDWE